MPSEAERDDFAALLATIAGNAWRPDGGTYLDAVSPAIADYIKPFEGDVEALVVELGHVLATLSNLAGLALHNIDELGSDRGITSAFWLAVWKENRRQHRERLERLERGELPPDEPS